MTQPRDAQPPDREPLRPIDAPSGNGQAPVAGLEPADIAPLLGAARAGSADAVAALTEQFRQYLWLVARRQIGPDLQGKVAPSDLVQETCLAAHQKFPQFRGQTLAELQAWLSRILLSKLWREVRRFGGTEKRNVLRELSLAGERGDLGAAITSLSGATPGAAAVRNELAGLVLAAIDELPEDYRRVIDLRNWQRLSFAQIGDKLGRSEDAARKLWTRAIDRLAAALDGLYGPD